MHKATVFFATIAIILGVGLGVTSWQLIVYNQAQEALPDNATAAVSIPGLRPLDAAREYQARSAVLFDANGEGLLFEQNAFERVSIASITKLMTAMVAIDYGLDWDQQITIELSEYVYGGRLLLHPGETATVRDLFITSLLSSANNATLAYVRSLNLTEKEFVQRMNRKAIELGLEQTQFVEVTGLDPQNLSTAYEVALLAAAAFQYPEIAEATSRASYSFVVGGSAREHTITNSNKIINNENQPFTGSKTGYLYEASYCIVVQGRGDLAGLIAVILGSPTEDGHFNEVQRLISRPT